MSRGLGWVRGLDPTEELREASAAHIGAAIERAGAHGPQGGIGRAPLILDQGDSESCTAHLGVGAIYGLTGVVCSPYVAWWAGRVIDAGSEEIGNVGVSLHGFVRALREHGAPVWPAWNPESPGFSYNVRPPAMARLGAQRRNLDIVPIYATGSGAVTAMVDALAQGLPGGVVVEVDRGYENPGADGVVGPESGSSRGLHAVSVWRWRTVAGRVQFLSPGSWGRGYAVDGCVWLDESRIAHSPFAGFSRGVQ